MNKLTQAIAQAWPRISVMNASYESTQRKTWR